MNNRFLLFLACILLFSVSACKKETTPVTSAATTPVAPNVNVLNTEFTTFSARGKMQLEKPDEKLGSAVTLRIKKDSVIWISVVPALGIEAARVRITPDTIQILDRLHRTYFAGNFSMLKQRYNISASFPMLQAMLLGNYIQGEAGMVKEIIGGELQQIQLLQNNLLINQFLDPKIRKVKRLDILDEKTGDAILTTYSEYETQAANVIPTSALILLQRTSATNPNSKTATISIKYNKFSFNEPDLAFPFSVPADYERK
ncbi:DUF4292 domain-containing protein [Adhaeribacter soli]|uniref:DUF4292 domain-containing protein n=1 Tax=Adhaeribacter soli TaxID=2607655 RepID=A0A5N1J8I7_9BACT|nr:DUF4292 domain-containing protein [Adhaeribacter soli]KAA9340991.1 DUF4292 domain-containing protein [Adhaeribacter soli]